jgi:hypothetical protein
MIFLGSVVCIHSLWRCFSCLGLFLFGLGIFSSPWQCLCALITLVGRRDRFVQTRSHRFSLANGFEGTWGGRMWRLPAMH